MRTEPLVSVPTAPKARPAATAAPEPEEEPPVSLLGFQGLRAGGQGRSWAVPPVATSQVAVLPMRIAPAAARRAQTGASAVGTRVANRAELPVVRMFAVSTMSLTAIGMP